MDDLVGNFRTAVLRKRVTTTGEMVKFFEALISSSSVTAAALKANPRIDILNFLYFHVFSSKVFGVCGNGRY